MRWSSKRYSSFFNMGTLWCGPPLRRLSIREPRGCASFVPSEEATKYLALTTLLLDTDALVRWGEVETHNATVRDRVGRPREASCGDQDAQGKTRRG
jgi:hypothetical protein